MEMIRRKYYEPLILVGFAQGNGCLIHYCYHWGLFLNDFMLGWCPDTSVSIISTSLCMNYCISVLILGSSS